ncbi:MAG: hypothetical protein FJ042_04255 [Candidatus Cloacimonetes bacterium]|nr:hypothetical protein [Candidatus Cloacimonadota bacterium]
MNNNIRESFIEVSRGVSKRVSRRVSRGEYQRASERKPPIEDIIMSFRKKTPERELQKVSYR